MKSSLQMLVMHNFIIQQNSIRQKSLLPEAATEPRCEDQVTHNLKKCGNVGTVPLQNIS